MDKKYYLKKELTPDLIRFLESHQYEEVRLCEFDTVSRFYLVQKPDSKESLEHQFMVHRIADEARKYTPDVITNSSSEPDVVISIPNKNPALVDRIAFEIETGSQIRNRKILSHKTSENNVKKYKEWWFIVADKNHKKEYQKYHQTMARKEVPDYLQRSLNGQ